MTSLLLILHALHHVATQSVEADQCATKSDADAHWEMAERYANLALASVKELRQKRAARAD